MFLARHGQGHRLTPSTINYRANIDALKRAGVTDLLAVSACGSYKKELYPGLFVLIDQLIDRTFKRETSFFGEGVVAHVAFSHPFSAQLRQRIAEAARAEEIAVHMGGTYVCMEGPQFSTLAELLGYQAQNADVIGMTVATEAKLAREAELPYAAIAMVTDYDCWHEEFGPVDVASVLKVAHENAARANALVAPRADRFSGRARELPRGPRARRRDHDRALTSRSGPACQARRHRGARAQGDGLESSLLRPEPRPRKPLGKAPRGDERLFGRAHNFAMGFNSQAHKKPGSSPSRVFDFSFCSDQLRRSPNRKRSCWNRLMKSR